jgi:hypothetical protein
MYNYLIGGAYALVVIGVGALLWTALQTVLFFAMLDIITK